MLKNHPKSYTKPQNIEIEAFGVAWKVTEILADQKGRNKRRQNSLQVYPCPVSGSILSYLGYVQNYPSIKWNLKNNS